MKQEDNKFTWGETVLVKIEAPNNFHPGSIASVCGMFRASSENLAKKYHAKLGDWIYTIEFIGGKDVEIPECYLEPYKEE